jgi:lipoate-protein ligase A
MPESRIDRRIHAPQPRPDLTLRVHVEPRCGGEVNMRRDAALLARQEPGMPPVLRLYSWSPPAISVGYMQDAAEILDLQRCATAGIDVVQRPTGGRAILHAEELTYALVAACDDIRFGTSLRDAHQIIGECLAASLRLLGVHAALSRPDRDPTRSLVREPCFASSGRAELLVGGRKLLGSAQRRNTVAFLQHGSLLVGRAHEDLADFMRFAPPTAAAARETTRAKLRAATITLQEILGQRPAFDALAQALVRGFTAGLGLSASFGDESALVDIA